jgi:hypothetical protein
VNDLSPMLTLMFFSKGGLLIKSINGEPSNLLCSAKNIRADLLDPGCQRNDITMITRKNKKFYAGIL